MPQRPRRQQRSRRAAPRASGSSSAAADGARRDLPVVVICTASSLPVAPVDRRSVRRAHQKTRHGKGDVHRRSGGVASAESVLQLLHIVPALLDAKRQSTQNDTGQLGIRARRRLDLLVAHALLQRAGPGVRRDRAGYRPERETAVVIKRIEDQSDGIHIRRRVRMPSQNSSGAIYSSSCGVNSPTVCWSVPPRYALSPRTEMLSGRMPPWK